MQLYSNNARSTLSGSILSSDTAINVVNGAVFHTPTGGDFELLTITDGANWEVIKVTSRDGNTLDVVERGHEGTARGWPSGTLIGGRITAGTMTSLFVAGTDQVEIGSGADASGESAIAIGDGAIADIQASVAVGWDAEATGNGGSAFGRLAKAQGGNSTAIGLQATVSPDGTSSTAVGVSAFIGNVTFASAFGAAAYVQAEGNDGLSLGRGAGVEGELGVSIGRAAYVSDGTIRGMAIGRSASAWGDNAVAIGWAAEALVAGSLNLAAVPIIGRDKIAVNSGTLAFQRLSSPRIALCSKVFELRGSAADDVATITVPAGCRFFFDEVQVIITLSSGVSGNGEIAVGTTSGGQEVLATTEITTNALGNRSVFTAATRHGYTGNILISRKVAASATQLSGRVIVTGILVENQ